VPHLRHGAGTGNGDGRGPGQSRVDRLHTPVLGGPRADRASVRAGNGGASDGTGHADSRPDLELDSVCTGDARRALGGVAVLPEGLGFAAQPKPQYVQPDRHRCRRRLDLQRCRRSAPGILSDRSAADGRQRAGLFRSGGDHHRPGSCRSNSRVARAGADLRRDPGAPRSHAKDRSTRAGGWRRRGHHPGSGRHWRPFAGSPGRANSGGRRGARRSGVDRRIHGHGRVDACHQGAGIQRRRRFAEQDRLLCHAR